jgi:hypothetical protein
MRPFFSLLPFLFAILLIASCSDSSVTNPPASSDLITIDSMILRSNIVNSINIIHRVAKQTKINISYEGECDVTPADSIAKIYVFVLIGAASDTGALVTYTTIYSSFSPTEIKKGLNTDINVSSYDPYLGMKFEIGFSQNSPGQTRTIKLKNVKVKAV